MWCNIGFKTEALPHKRPSLTLDQSARPTGESNHVVVLDIRNTGGVLRHSLRHGDLLPPKMPSGPTAAPVSVSVLSG